MPDANLKNKQLFDLYQNIKNGTEVLTFDDLELAIKTIESAKETIKEKQQRKIQMDALEELKKKKHDLSEKIVYLPEGLKSIGENEFRNNKEITRVVINRGLTQIGEYAFAGCSNLKEVIFPQSKIMLRRGSFKDCVSLKEVYIPDIATICPSAFENCTTLEKVILPSTISNIYTKVFKNCSLLHTVEFEQRGTNYTAIHSRVFENCFSLEKIELPNRCGVDVKTFFNCHNLKTIYTHHNWMYKRNFENCNAEVILLE